MDRAHPATLPRLRVAVMILSAVGASVLLVFLRLSQVTLVSSFPGTRLNHEASYQLITLGVVLLFVGLAALLGGRGVFRYLDPRKFAGTVAPVPWLGIGARKDENWKQVGLNFLVVITIVTAIVVYLPVLRHGGITFSVTGVLLPALVFAATNSFVEEGIYRFSITGVFLENGFPPTIAAITSGMVFGGVHYFGNPGGIAGIILAGFLGWFLSKSVAETRGFGWAWTIHFVQDVVIFVAVFGAV